MPNQPGTVLIPSHHGPVTCGASQLQKQQLEQPGNISITCAPSQPKKKKNQKGMKKKVVVNAPMTPDSNLILSAIVSDPTSTEILPMPMQGDPQTPAPIPCLDTFSSTTPAGNKPQKRSRRKQNGANQSSNTSDLVEPSAMTTQLISSAQVLTELASVPGQDITRMGKCKKGPSHIAQKGMLILSYFCHNF
jgi:hypothetical protein